uniref:EF-hand domain-containing protein n=1 Tax=Neobodo designis TaxID=312471 RepID=A0A7S1M5A0_NEODS
MPGPFTTERELDDVRRQRAAIDEALVQALESRQRDVAGTLEREGATLDARIEELESVLQLAGERGRLQASPSLHRLVYRATRVPSAQPPPLNVPCVLTDPSKGDTLATEIPLELSAFAKDVGRWSVANTKRDITSVIVASHSSFLGIIEGPRDSVRALAEKMAEDTRMTDWVTLCEQSGRGRVAEQGCVLSVVDDPMLAVAIERMQRCALDGHRFAPAAAINVARRGAHPLASVPSPSRPHVVLAVSLDGLCGAVHRPDRYRRAAAAVQEAILKHTGSVIDRFGEWMTAWFPYVGGATAATAAAMMIHTSVDFAVMSITEGPLCVSDSPSVVACGAAHQEAIRLLHAAEAMRRPLVISEPAGERVNRARQPVEHFTHNLVGYFTHLELSEKRLDSPPEPDLIGSYNPPPEPEAPKPLVQDDARPSGKQIAYVRGARTQEDLETMFRKLDKANVGWVSKQEFVAAVAKDPEFPKCIDELAEVALTGWLERCNKLGESRLSFNEFAIVCLKLDAS